MHSLLSYNLKNTIERTEIQFKFGKKVITDFAQCMFMAKGGPFISPQKSVCVDTSYKVVFLICCVMMQVCHDQL